MEIDLTAEFIVSGHTYKEVQENLQAQVDAFLKGAKGVKVKTFISPDTQEMTLAGFNQIVAWECTVMISQASSEAKK